MSQIWSRAVLDIDVSYDTDLRFAQGIIQRVADEVWRDPNFTDGEIIDPPEVWGVERFGADGISIRLVVKTDPSDQWVVARELRQRIKEAFDEAGIEIPFPQRTVWLNPEDRSAPKPDPAAIRTVTPRRSGHEFFDPADQIGE
jgi:small conductance mechanosensitive channel